MKVHRRVRPKDAVATVCGRWATSSNNSPADKDVTCKACRRKIDALKEQSPPH